MCALPVFYEQAWQFERPCSKIDHVSMYGIAVLVRRCFDAIRADYDGGYHVDVVRILSKLVVKDGDSIERFLFSIKMSSKVKLGNGVTHVKIPQILKIHSMHVMGVRSMTT